MGIAGKGKVGSEDFPKFFGDAAVVLRWEWYSFLHLFISPFIYFTIYVGIGCASEKGLAGRSPLSDRPDPRSQLLQQWVVQ